MRVLSCPKRKKVGRDRYYTDTGLFRSLAVRLGRTE